MSEISTDDFLHTAPLHRAVGLSGSQNTPHFPLPAPIRTGEETLITRLDPYGPEFKASFSDDFLRNLPAKYSGSGSVDVPKLSSLTIAGSEGLKTIFTSAAARLKSNSGSVNYAVGAGLQGITRFTDVFVTLDPSTSSPPSSTLFDNLPAVKKVSGRVDKFQNLVKYVLRGFLFSQVDSWKTTSIMGVKNSASQDIRLLNIYSPMPGHMYCLTVLVSLFGHPASSVKEAPAGSISSSHQFLLHYWFNIDCLFPEILEGIPLLLPEMQHFCPVYYAAGLPYVLANLWLRPSGIQISPTGVLHLTIKSGSLTKTYKMPPAILGVQHLTNNNLGKFSMSPAGSPYAADPTLSSFFPRGHFSSKIPCLNYEPGPYGEHKITKKPNFARYPWVIQKLGEVFLEKLGKEPVFSSYCAEGKYNMSTHDTVKYLLNATPEFKEMIRKDIQDHSQSQIRQQYTKEGLITADSGISPLDMERFISRGFYRDNLVFTS